MPQAGSHKAVFLVGFMGAGKTSVGRSLARRLGWDFEDLDDRIQARAGRSITAIFRDLGEAEFRRMENTALRELVAELVASSPAQVVFLDGPAEELFRRCEKEQRERPLLQDVKQFRELYEQRRSSYLKASRCIDTTGKEIDQIAAEVACSIGLE
jgi:shikimate kinase